MMSLNSLSALTLSTPWKNRIFCKMVTSHRERRSLNLKAFKPKKEKKYISLFV